MRENRVELREPGGHLVVAARTYRELDDYVGSPGMPFRPAISWAWLVEQSGRCRVSDAEVYAEMRRSFGWRFFLEAATKMLAMSSSHTVANGARTLNDATPREDRQTLLRAMGNAFERYVWRVLLRLEKTLATGSVEPVPVRRGRKRCDFAVVCGDDLLLLDAKHGSLPAAHLMGGGDYRATYARNFEAGCLQLLETAQAILTDGPRSVVPTLTVSDGWRPRRILGALVTHRPVWMVYGSPKKFRSSIPSLNDWPTVFIGEPFFWPVSDLEHLELIGGDATLRDIFDRTAANDPRILGGLASAFHMLGYPGQSLGYYGHRTSQILGRDE